MDDGCGIPEQTRVIRIMFSVIVGCVTDDGCGIPEQTRVIRLVFSVNRQDGSIRILV